MSERARPWLLAATLCGFVVAADQIAKAIVEAELVPGEQIDLLGPLNLTLSHNEGIAFGLARGAGMPLIAFTLVALGAIGVMFARDPERRGVWIAMGLVAGGAIGNLIDRVRIGAVTDFVDLPSWPPFNLADVAIVLGVALLAVLFISEPEKEGERGG